MICKAQTSMLSNIPISVSSKQGKMYLSGHQLRAIRFSFARLTARRTTWESEKLQKDHKRSLKKEQQSFVS